MKISAFEHTSCSMATAFPKGLEHLVDASVKELILTETSFLLFNYENINNNLFYQESNTFGTVILKYFTKRTQLPKGPPKSTQAFQGETFELE